MENNFSLESDDPDKQIEVIQNISTLDLTLFNKSVDDSESYEIPQSSDAILNKCNEIHENITNYKDKLIKKPKEYNDDIIRNELNDKNLKIISVEIDFLKQSVSYLQSQIHSKTLEINSKDEKISKLERVIEKQKKKLKDLKSRVKFQETKLFQMEDRLPKYHELLDKYKIQETYRVDLDEKYSKLETLFSRMDTKKGKFTSSSPKPKNPASPYRLGSPRVKKYS